MTSLPPEKDLPEQPQQSYFSMSLSANGGFGMIPMQTSGTLTVNYAGDGPGYVIIQEIGVTPVFLPLGTSTVSITSDFSLVYDLTSVPQKQINLDLTFAYDEAK